jgi:hypothetical protein
LAVRRVGAVFFSSALMRESPPGFGRAFNLHIESADLGEQKGTVVNFDPPLTPREVAQALNISAPALRTSRAEQAQRRQTRQKNSRSVIRG